MRLEDLVPPLDLCKQLKPGDFADSALVWVYFHSGWQNKMEWSVFERSGQDDYPTYPAPTLAEILEAAHDSGILFGWHTMSVIHESASANFALEKLIEIKNW